jgi:hypothetical protein
MLRHEEYHHKNKRVCGSGVLSNQSVTNEDTQISLIAILLRSQILGQENPSAILFRTNNSRHALLQDRVYQDNYDSGSTCGKPITEGN